MPLNGANFKLFYACTSSAWTTHIKGGKAKIWCVICGN
jgi:hypothetical protein